MQGKVFAESFTDHHYYKGIEASKLYLMDDGSWMFYSRSAGIYAVKLVRLDYDNLGDPFRELCELTMDTLAGGRLYMTLSKSDGERVWNTGVQATDELLKCYKWSKTDDPA